MFGWYQPKLEFLELIWDSRYFPTLALKIKVWGYLEMAFWITASNNGAAAATTDDDDDDDDEEEEEDDDDDDDDS